MPRRMAVAAVCMRLAARMFPAVPSKILRGLDREIKSLVVVPVYQDHLRAINQQLGNLGWRRRPWGKDHRALPNRGSHPGQRGASVAGRGGHHHLGMDLASTRYHHRAGAAAG